MTSHSTNKGRFGIALKSSFQQGITRYGSEKKKRKVEFLHFLTRPQRVKFKADNLQKLMATAPHCLVSHAKVSERLLWSYKKIKGFVAKISNIDCDLDL